MKKLAYVFWCTSSLYALKFMAKITLSCVHTCCVMAFKDTHGTVCLFFNNIPAKQLESVSAASLSTKSVLIPSVGPISTVVECLSELPDYIFFLRGRKVSYPFTKWRTEVIAILNLATAFLYDLGQSECSPSSVIKPLNHLSYL